MRAHLHKKYLAPPKNCVWVCAREPVCVCVYLSRRPITWWCIVLYMLLQALSFSSWLSNEHERPGTRERERALSSKFLRSVSFGSSSQAYIYSRREVVFVVRRTKNERRTSHTGECAGEVKTKKKTLFDVDEVARASSLILLHASADGSTKCSSKLLISVFFFFFPFFFVKARKLRKKRLSFEFREK